LLSLSWKGTHVGLCAAVERGPSEGARSGSTRPTWVPCVSFFALVHRPPRGWANLHSLRASNEHIPFFLPLSSEVAGMVSIARIERPPLHRGGSASTETMPAVSLLRTIPPSPKGLGGLPFTARVERAHSDRARSASKKGTWPLPSPLSRRRSARRLFVDRNLLGPSSPHPMHLLS
jgi:hypothetical protein